MILELNLKNTFNFLNNKSPLASIGFHWLPLASSATQNPVQALLHRLQMSPRRCTTLPIRVLSTALLPRRSLSASISCRWRSSNSTLKNCDNWASRIFDIRPSCLEWSSNKLERSYTDFSGLQETIENTLFHDDVNSGNAPLRRLFERRITNTSFNSIQFKSSFIHHKFSE